MLIDSFIYAGHTPCKNGVVDALMIKTAGESYPDRTRYVQNDMERRPPGRGVLGVVGSAMLN